MAPVGEATGDHRRVEAFTNRPLPLPHRWQPEEDTGHMGSRIVGLTDAMAKMRVKEAVERGWISPKSAEKLRPDMLGVFGAGELFTDADPLKMPKLAEDANTALYLASKGVLGPSVGPGEAEFYGVVHPGTRNRVTEEEMAAAAAAGRKLPTENLFDHYQIAETTLVPVPAFGETSAPFEILDDDQAAELALTAALGSTDLPVADRDLEWDGDAAHRRVFDHYTSDGGEVDTDAVARAFLWRDPDADPSNMTAYGLGFADIVDGELRIVPRGVAATAGGRGVNRAKIPAAAKAQIKGKICMLYDTVRLEYDDWPECPFEQMALTAAVRTSGWSDMPIADREREWDADAALGRVGSWAGVKGAKPDWDGYAQAHLYVDPDAAPSTIGAYGFPVADVIDGTLTLVPRGVFAAANVLSGGHGGTKISPADQAKMRQVVGSMYDRMAQEWDDSSVVAPWEEARAAIVAAACRTDVVYPADVFTADPGDRVVPLTVEPRREGEDFQRIRGYAAQWRTCHTGIRNICTKAPQTRTGYAFFHRFPVNTSDGLVAAGRLTTGHGRVGTGCTHAACRGKDDHACDLMSIAQTITHYDGLKTAAFVRATETDQGIWLSGATVDPELSDADRAVFDRRKVSGDWRPHSGDFEMVEVLALAEAEPGFPINLHRGRQTALLAAGAVLPDEEDAEPTLARQVAGEVVAQLKREGLVPEPAIVAADELPGSNSDDAVATPHTGAMIALIPTAEDAERLAVMGGEDPEQLHVTLMCLGEAAGIDSDMRTKIVGMVRDWVDTELRPDYGGAPIEADGFSVNIFNPPGTTWADGVQRDSYIVLGMGGADLESLHELTEATMFGSGMDVPEQHAPWAPHITLNYTDNVDSVGGYADRVGPVEFDRIRVAFGDEVHDIPITGDVEEEEEAETQDEAMVAATAGRMAELAASVERDALLAEVG